MSQDVAFGVDGPSATEPRRRTLAAALSAAPAGGPFDRLTRRAAAALQAPTAVLIAEGEQGKICKGTFGLPEPLFAMRDQVPSPLLPQDLGAEPLALANAADDRQYSRHPALEQAGLVAMLAVPLHEVPAWFAVLDRRPRTWTPADIDLLRDLGRCVVAELQAGGPHRSPETRTGAMTPLLDGIPHGLFLLDPAGHMRLCNRAAARFFQQVCGVDPEHLQGMDIWQQCPEVADSTFAKESRQAEREQRTFQTETYIPTLRRWFAFHGAHVAEGLCVSMQDVTARVEMERSLRSRASELAEANRGKEDFLLQLAHEVRNALAPVRTALHLWSTHDGGNTQEYEARHMALTELQHISGLLEDLLKLSRLAPTDLPPKLTRIDLAGVAAHSVNALLATPAARGRRFALNLPTDPLPIEGEPEMLEKVVAHLLDNAVKFTRAGGQITVEVSRDKNDALLRVRDDGIGIAPDMLPRVFNLFMRPDRPGGRLQGGIGVGLALVRRVVELHGGRVEARSEGAGRGSEFVVRLPALAEANGAAGSAQPPMRVLIVDDSRHAAESMALLLRVWGYEVRVAFDPLAALDDARAHPPHVVLLDIGMPGMDGYEVARRLRAQEESRNALLVAVTGYGEDDDRRQALGAGFDYHIVKPADPEELRELLRVASSLDHVNVAAR